MEDASPKRRRKAGCYRALRVPGPYRVYPQGQEFVVVCVLDPQAGVTMECMPPRRYDTSAVAYIRAVRMNREWQQGKPLEEQERYRTCAPLQSPLSLDDLRALLACTSLQHTSERKTA